MSNELAEAIEAVEAGYEYFLAYAAQGFESFQEGAHIQDVRRHLQSTSVALDRLRDLNSLIPQGKELTEAFITTVQKDAEKAASVVDLILAQEGVSSQLVDNFNASTHIRTILTDLFLLDEVLK